MSQLRPPGLQSRITSVSIWRTRSGTTIRSSRPSTVGKIARTSSSFATYSPHWTGTPISFLRSRRRTFSPRRAAYRAAVDPAGPAPPTTTSYTGAHPDLAGEDELHQGPPPGRDVPLPEGI